jgi:hypothetical protein
MRTLNDSQDADINFEPAAPSRVPGDSTREALLLAFGGSPRGWRYIRCEGPRNRTEQAPKSHCACGHRAEELFIWVHCETGREVATGSTCLHYVDGLDPDSLETIREHELNRASQVREVRRRAQLERNAEYERDLCTLITAFCKYSTNEDSIAVEARWKMADAKKLRTPRRRLELLEEFLAELIEWYGEVAESRLAVAA